MRIGWVPFAVGLAAITWAPGGASAFGLRCWSYGSRYHYEITRKAAEGAGFSKPAAHLMAWNADLLDLYLDHPSWDIYSFMNKQWSRLHFDDLFETRAVLNQWKRYVHGTYLGLLWAAEHEDYHSALNILGVAAHAFEDFYSHSNWVDDAHRRRRTPLDYSPEALAKMDLWTAAWEEKAPKGRAHHGGKAGGRGCGCDPDPDAGINLDRPCSAEIAAKNRKTSDHASGLVLFDAARRLARTTVRKLIKRFGRWLEEQGHRRFWRRLQRYDAGKPKGRRRWKLSRFDRHSKRSLATIPWGFLTGGVYGSSPGWHLRVQIRTADGTDGDVRIVSGGYAAKLDRGQYDDFERGDDDAYYIGPFASDFESLTLRLRNRGRRPSWRIARLQVWAYRSGTDPAYGKILDVRNVRLNNSAKTWKVSEPDPLEIDLDAFN